LRVWELVEHAVTLRVSGSAVISLMKSLRTSRILTVLLFLRIASRLSR
jgi:hypothetical protein